MAATSVGYLERLLDGVDAVQAGRPGAISGDRWLSSNYEPDRLRLILPYLDYEDSRVRAECVLLLATVRERAARPKIESMRRCGDDRVEMACLGYFSALADADEAAETLLDTIEHVGGEEYSLAARRLAAVARTEDLPRVRRVYGQVGGRMREEAAAVLEAIISRDPSLEPTRDLILSVPVYPDESKFEAFLDSSTEYLDVRYRENVLPRRTVSQKTYANVASAVRRMRVRLYNEADNLRYYGPDKADRAAELSALVKWAAEDLSRKEVVRKGAEPRSRECSRCGGPLVLYKGSWTCPECGGAQPGASESSSNRV